MKVVAVIQARLGSTRLPAKVLLDLAGKTVLERCLERVKQFRGISEIVVATTDNPQDELIGALAERCDVRVYRGDEHDVLKRYVEAARQAKADAVIRCTSDCPLLDPEISSQVIEQFLASELDYASNILERRLPRGLDTEVFSREALERADRNAFEPEEREHVTLHMVRSSSDFKRQHRSPANLPDLSHHRWTLDTLDDYFFLASVFNKLGSQAASAAMSDILGLLNTYPELALINHHVKQKNV